MKTRTFLKFAVVIAGLLCATAFQAVAQQGQGGGRRGGAGVLTAEQRTQLNEAIQNDLQPLQAKLAEAQKAALDAILADASDIRAKVEAVNKIQTDIMMVRVKGLKGIKLTDEQKTTLKESPGGFMSLMGGGFGGGGRGRRGGGN